MWGFFLTVGSNPTLTAVMKNNQVTISGAIVFKDYGGKRKFLVVKQGEDGKWEIPKVTVRKGESSVRASLRMTGEMAGINARVLEEAGRASGATVLNGKSVPVKYYYYVLVQKAAGEMLGFDAFEWLEYRSARAKLFLKREKDMLKGAKEVLKLWDKGKLKRG
jgi:ADP-ribose pyrophosphatase YjhB (NUDIX family)